MTFQSVPDCAEAVISFNSDGQIIYNVLGFHSPTGYGSSAISQLADLVDTQVASLYLPHISVGVVYLNTLVRGLRDINDFTAVANAGSGVGGVAGNALPGNVSLCVTERSALSGRSARGRFYAVPTGVSQQFTQNTFATAYVTGIETFLNDLRTAAAAIGWDHCVISRRTGGAPRTTGTFFKIINSAARNHDIDSQRRRLLTGH